MYIIVDLFNQHSGNVDELKRLVLNAYLAGADAVKIQLLNSQKIWGDNSRKYLEMSFEQVKSIHQYCKNLDIEFFASVFDEEKLEWLDELGVNFHKIASVTSKNNLELCEKILSKNKTTFISLGQYEPNKFPFGFNNKIKYLFCISKYPTFLNDDELKNLPNKFSESSYIGYSDHCVGIAAALKSYINGAKYIEKHFTSDIFLQNINEKAHLCSFTKDSLKEFKTIIRQMDILSGVK